MGMRISPTSSSMTMSSVKSIDTVDSAKLKLKSRLKGLIWQHKVAERLKILWQRKEIAENHSWNSRWSTWNSNGSIIPCMSTSTTYGKSRVEWIEEIVHKWTGGRWPQSQQLHGGNGIYQLLTLLQNRFFAIDCYNLKWGKQTSCSFQFTVLPLSPNIPKNQPSS